MLLLVLVAAGLWSFRPSDSSISGKTTEVAGTEPDAAVTTPAVPAAPGPLMPDVGESLETLLAEIRESDPRKSQEALTNFYYSQLRPQASSHTVGQLIEFLDSGVDAKTGLEFRVGPGKTLREWPTLRVAVLDWLGRLSPEEAAVYAEKIFSQTSSADEYAIALRNFAVGKPEERAALAQYFIDLIGNDTWRTEAPAAYLEAFDIAAHLADPRLVQPLSAGLAPGNLEPVRKASFLALDRMAQQDPRAILAAALDDPSLAQTPNIRASVISRADVRDPGQLQLVEQYVLNNRVTAEEFSTFIQAFPNGSATMTYGLVSDNKPLSFAEVAQQDRAALEQVRRWQGDPRFKFRQAALIELEKRLNDYVASAGRAGLIVPE